MRKTTELQRITRAYLTRLIVKSKEIFNSFVDEKDELNVLKEILSEKYKELKQHNEDIVTLLPEDEIENITTIRSNKINIAKG